MWIYSTDIYYPEAKITQAHSSISHQSSRGGPGGMSSVRMNTSQNSWTAWKDVRLPMGPELPFDSCGLWE